MKLLFIDTRQMLQTVPADLDLPITLQGIYSYFEKVCRKKNVYATIPKGNMRYDQYAVPDTVAVQSSIVAFL